MFLILGNDACGNYLGVCLSLGSFWSEGEQRETNTMVKLEFVFNSLMPIELFKGI